MQVIILLFNDWFCRLIGAASFPSSTLLLPYSTGCMWMRSIATDVACTRLPVSMDLSVVAPLCSFIACNSPSISMMTNTGQNWRCLQTKTLSDCKMCCHLIHSSWAHLSSQPKQHLSRFIWGGSRPPSNTCFLGPIRVHSPSSIQSVYPVL